MQLWKSWVIATKDFSIFRRKKRIIYSLIVVPLLMSIGLPLVIQFMTRPDAPTDEIIILMNAFSYFYVILAYIIPSTLASYSILGEKIEKSLEPLLATPTTDSELLFGKTIASFLPCICVIYVSSIIFMVLIDLFTYNAIGYLFFPNWSMVFILLLAVPLSSILSIQLNVIISSRVNDVRTANQLAFLLFIPFMGVYFLIVANAISLSITTLFLISVTLFIIDAALFYLSKATFSRDEILTKWK
ncbi:MULTISPECIES: ABC transporter permease subunit [Methanobacterium]|jgi:ABC-type Na+ efflux pump permease subunit|uniref:ABC transporter permease subunit n=1 Tax=Methanobacterium veterum TaxID=408577 RepID=A0A9E5A6G1_9EURY|nr:MULTISPECIES: ABC transporter permease subunit [Methanobacterium]MCZ3364729.1 ABC transporter permease subunit [Methanobacterium veterum]MCZ3372483.1 ABC transporter permease subunit [Methanobacterium veterum]